MSDCKTGTFALLTPPGEGGIAVFAVEGPGAREVLVRAVRSKRIASLNPGELAYGKLVDAGGAVLDEVIVAALPPRGVTPLLATGNCQPATAVSRFELNCHAGGAAAAAVAERLRELGLEETAEPPEDPGLSPADAEFRRMLPAVKTRRQLEALCQWRAAQDPVFRVRGSGFGVQGTEAGKHRIPASEPKTPNPEPPDFAAILKTHRVVIAGPVNAGKSTLFNRLAGSDRAITSPHPGTTRDAVAAEVSVRGLAVELVDTAGLGRVEGDALAAEAQELTRQELAAADLVLVVLDAAMPGGAGDAVSALLRSSRRAIVVLNKSDLAAVERAGGVVSGVRFQVSEGMCQSPSTPDTRNLTPDTSVVPTATVKVSALTGAGIEELSVAIEKLLLGEQAGQSAEAP